MLLRCLALVTICLSMGCKKKPAAPAEEGSAKTEVVTAPTGLGSSAASAPPTPTPAPAAAPADPSFVELLHGLPSTIRVSSKVANKSIQPKHIADKSMQTAWNSRTGDLQGAWIDVDVPGALIAELRMTVGHTGKGTKGEDYFMMNPRITKVAVLDGQKVIATVGLDPNKRELQTIKLPARMSHVRVRVESFQPGLKPSWREICVSEIEAWGTLPAGTTAQATQPRIEIGDPPDNAWAQSPIADASEYCAKLMKEPRERYQQYIEADRREAEECAAKNDPNAMCGNPDPPGEPACSIEASAKVHDDFWAGAGTMQSTNDSVYGARPTQLVVQTRDGFWPVGEEIDCGSFGENGHCELSVTAAKVIPKGQVLEVKYHLHTWNGDHDYTMQCLPGGDVKCQPPVEAKP